MDPEYGDFLNKFLSATKQYMLVDLTQ